MEECTTKNKKFNSLLEKVQKANLYSKSNIIDCNITIKNIWKTSEFNKENPDKAVMSAIKKFYDSYNEIFVQNKETPVAWRQFVKNTFDVLNHIDNYKIELILQSLNDCQTQLENLENSTVITYLKDWFKDFSNKICQCFKLLQRRLAELQSATSCNNIYLYIIQLTVGLQILFKLFIKEMSNKVLIVESRRFLIKRLIYCFDGIRKILREDSEFESTPGFIQCMDHALDLISVIDPNNPSAAMIENAKNSIEEVLCHAMSIAQISSEEDCKRIKAGIETVLYEFKQLRQEQCGLNPSLRNLYIDIVSDKLCLLERKVNTAVLNISLKVFSDYSEPLRKLQNICEESDLSILTRSENDLDEYIAALDMQVDCLMQIGLFAIACSTNTNIIAKIRSYLASLESLESELVPALTALYMEPSKIACLHASIFVEHWCSEVKKLKNDVCFIIDPLAFGQVVYEDYKLNVEEIKNNLSNEKYILTKDLLNNIIKRIKLYVLVVKASVSDMNLQVDSNILKHFKNMKDVYNEVIAASNFLPENTDRKFTERVFKRLQILQTMIDRLVHDFTETNNTTKVVSHVTNSGRNSVLCDVTNTNKNLKMDMQGIHEEGQKILKNRSVLYKTPCKQNTTNSKSLLTSTKKIDTRKMGTSFIRNIGLTDGDTTEKKNITMDLQITEILDELSCLADTLK